MKHLLTLLIIVLLSGLAVLKGNILLKTASPAGTAVATPTPSSPVVPYIGRVQVLNGCGAGGSAHRIAEFLRKNHFDVKNIGNADNWNYPETLIIARTGDTTIAAQVAEVLNTKNMVMIRNQEKTFDVTVIVGPDYRERVQ
jgi:hypothetical protein